MSKDFFKNNFKGDPIIWIVYSAFLVISIIEVFSATSSLSFGRVFKGDFYAPIFSHIKYIVFGVGLCYLIHLADMRVWRRIYFFLPLGSILLLIYTSLRGSSVNDAARWVSIGGIPVQASELVKLAVVLITAYLLSRMTADKDNNRRLFVYMLCITVVSCGFIFLENLSTALILALTCVFMWIIGRVCCKYIVGCVLAGALVVGPLLWAGGTEWFQDNFSSGVLHRVVTMHNRIFPPKGSENSEDSPRNFQQNHGFMAIANSRVIGRGPGNSEERTVLPQAFSDFIFAIIIEELGLLGALVVICLYLIFFWRVCILVAHCDCMYACYLVFGLAVMICTQALVNMQVTVGGFVTGQPLPFISRGGASMIMCSVFMGIILSVSARDKYLGVKPDSRANADAADAASAQPSPCTSSAQS